ncbi:hypothetical protein BTIS_1630 [Bifidobacterium tissieri]|uniref:Uncharacterized protein n=1 Tax=Bifidobacterium tissieri TaxID=1630162 RepID=A0A261FCZ3_9BIFI|nr:hypothetical protein BTIS_1630 [Bifidobacterium tissieri]
MDSQRLRALTRRVAIVADDTYSCIVKFSPGLHISNADPR